MNPFLGGSLAAMKRLAVVPLLDNDQTPLATTTIKVTVLAGNVLEILWGDGTSSTVTCNGVLNTYTHDYAATGTYTIGVRGNWKSITQWQSYSQAFLSGDISRFAPLTAMTTLLLYSTGVSGDIASLAGMTSMQYLLLNSTGVSGDIASLAGMTSIKNLTINNTIIGGNLSSLSGMTVLRDLLINNTNITGDLSDIATIFGVAGVVWHLYLYGLNLTYTSPTALPAWAGADIRIYDCGLDATEVDNFLIDFANGVGTGGKLWMAGTNGTRTAASDAAKAALLATVPAWDLQVNE